MRSVMHRSSTHQQGVAGSGSLRHSLADCNSKALRTNTYVHTHTHAAPTSRTPFGVAASTTRVAAARAVDEVRAL